jgi:hypothetical protein
MMESIQTQRDDIIGFRIDGTASEADLKPLLNTLKEKLKSYEKLRLYVEYVDNHGFSMDTLLEDLEYNFGKLDQFEKAAVITIKDNIKQANQLARELAKMKLKSFHFSEKAQAFQWIEE